MTYKETKEMGNTDIVYWNSEPIINPITGNVFFAPNDAKAIFEKLKIEHCDEIIKEKECLGELFEEVWGASNYIWEAAASLDDLIYEEDKDLFQ